MPAPKRPDRYVSPEELAAMSDEERLAYLKASAADHQPLHKSLKAVKASRELIEKVDESAKVQMPQTHAVGTVEAVHRNGPRGRRERG